jgi:PAS domain S-box-containing protein
MDTQRLSDWSVILVALALSGVFWVCEAIIHVLVFEDSGLLEQIIEPPIHEIWQRLTVIALLLIFAFYSRSMLKARQRAEEAKLQASAELEQIFETAADGMRVVDRDFNVLRANDTFAGMAGLPKKDIIGKKCYEVFKGPLCDTPSCPLVRVLGNPERVDYDAEKERWDGAKVPCIVSATPLRRSNGEVLGIVEDFKDISERRQAENDLMASENRLRQLTAHLLEVREDERTRIARELHDELGQSLTALKMDLRWLTHRLPESETGVLEKANAMKGLIDNTMESVSRICSELRPGILDDFGLSAAVQWQADEFTKRTGISCDITSQPPEIVVDPNLSTTVFRIFQETLTNITRHAQATEVQAKLKLADGVLEMRVCDNGRGMRTDESPNHKSFGLLGIRERVRERNGDFVIRDGTNGGTCIEIRVPLTVSEDSELSLS